jgi:hypothetical protein
MFTKQTFPRPAIFHRYGWSRLASLQGVARILRRSAFLADEFNASGVNRTDQRVGLNPNYRGRAVLRPSVSYPCEGLSRGVLAGTLARGCSTALCLRKRCAMRVWWGAVAQLGERLVRNEEVSGSIPLSSTIE